MHTFSDKIPVALSNHAKKLIVQGGLNTLEAMLIRLIDSLEMQSVWKILMSHADSPQKLIDFFEYVRLHDAVLRGNAEDGKLDTPSKTIQRKAFLKIQKSIISIVDELKNLSGENSPEVGWVLLEAAITRSELAFTENHQDIISLKSYLQNLQNQTSIVDVLDAIQVATTLAANAPASNLPVKRNSSRAKINWLIQDLSEYCLNEFIKPLDAVVASTVNTVFDLIDSDIDADYVAKLRKQKTGR